MFEMLQAFSNASKSFRVVMDVIEGNEMLFTLFAASILFMGASLVKKIKSTSKH